MRVGIDEPGRDDEAVTVEGRASAVVDLPHPHYAAVADPDVGHNARSAGPVHDGGPRDQVVEHPASIEAPGRAPAGQWRKVTIRQIVVDAATVPPSCRPRPCSRAPASSSRPCWARARSPPTWPTWGPTSSRWSPRAATTSAR